MDSEKDTEETTTLAGIYRAPGTALPRMHFRKLISSLERDGSDDGKKLSSMLNSEQEYLRHVLTYVRPDGVSPFPNASTAVSIVTSSD